MHHRTEYLVLIYKDLPDTDFLCECNGGIRLKITKVNKSRFFELSRKSLCAILDTCVLVFEDVSHSLVAKDDILRAISWYKKWAGQPRMLLLNADH